MRHNGLHLHETFNQQRLHVDHEPLTGTDRLIFGVIWLGLCLSLCLGVGMVVGLSWLVVNMVREVARMLAR